MYGLSIILVGCSKPKVIEINEAELLDNIKYLSSDSFEGRLFGSEKNKEARKFVIKKFKEIGLNPINNSFEQEFPKTLKNKLRHKIYPIKKNPSDDFSNVPDTTVVGGNAYGTIKGKIDKDIIITAHIDHLGVRNGKIYNGADDNASGLAAILQVAKYFKKNNVNHNLIFVAVDGEELNSCGAEYFLKSYKNKDNIAINVNMDMIAHSDYDPILFASGIYHYPKLRKPLSKVKSDKIEFLFGHDDANNREQADWTFSSDHQAFYRENIPHIYFGVPDHKDYHKSTDTFETINQEFYIEAVKIIIRSIENLDDYLSKNKI